jgi:hypothetical protein
MTGRILNALVLLVALILSSVSGQGNSAPMSACGDLNAKFEVKQSNLADLAQPETGKALVYFIEKDLTVRTFATPTTRVGVDGKWAGATHGDSHLVFSIDPGDHHVCAYTQFGGVGGEGAAFAHFNAEPGGVYYLEIKNMRVSSGLSDDLLDVTLLQPDSDQGKYLTSGTPLVVASQKKK